MVVTGACKLLMVATLRCVRPQFQWYQLAHVTEIKSIQLHDSIVGLRQQIVSSTFDTRLINFTKRKLFLKNIITFTFQMLGFQPLVCYVLLVCYVSLVGYVMLCSHVMSSKEMMVLHHSNDLPNDPLDLDLDLGLDLDLDFRHNDH